MSYVLRKIDEPYAQILDRIFGVENCLLEANPGKCLVPPTYPAIGQKILDMKMRSDDVLLVSFPRTGSTWCLELLWLLKNNFDFDAAKKKMLQNRAPFLELSSIFDCPEVFPWMVGFEDSIEAINSWPSPRILRTHLPLDLLPIDLNTVQPKIIYVARNPKDVAISYYHYCQCFHDVKCTLDEFCELFLDGMLPYGNYFDHVKKFWRKRNEPNVFFLTYEEMRKDMESSVERLAKFLNVSVEKEQKEKLLTHLSFENMKRNTACNMKAVVEFKKGKDFCSKNEGSFMRKGEIGDWENHMTKEMSQKFDGFIRDNTVDAEELRNIWRQK